MLSIIFTLTIVDRIEEQTESLCPPECWRLLKACFADPNAICEAGWTAHSERLEDITELTG
jgi:hypothetical protein